MSHAARISAYYHSRANISLQEISEGMMDEITMLTLETEREFDSHDPSCMPHVFQAKLERWSYVITRIATVDADPVTALRCAFNGVIATAVECRAFDRDWNEKTWHAGRKQEMSYLEINANIFLKRGMADPEDAARRAIEAQKDRAVAARACAIKTLTDLATLYPAEAVGVLDRPAMMTFEQVSNHLKAVFDPFTFRDQLAESLPSGAAPATIIAKTPLPAPDDFY